MRYTHLLLAMPLVFGLYACGDDTPNSPDNQPPLSSDSTGPGPLPASSSDGGTTPPPPQSSASTPVTTVALATNANIANATALYATWKNRWIMTLQEEKAGGSTLDYELFDGPRAQELLTAKMGAFHNNPARVIWDGGNKNQCALTGMTTWKGTAMTAALLNKIGCSVSEGIGYGMLIAYFHGDKELFDALWAYNIIARDNNNNGLMPWELLSFSATVSTAAALDADLDVATALILASRKWANPLYLNDAMDLITSIKNKGLNPTNLLIRPGDTWANKDVYNLSYLSPAALRLFAEVDPTAGWDVVLATNYAYMIQIQDAGAVPLFPDWSNAAGEPTDPKNGSAANTYMLFDKESVRIPWRIAWDYYWYQSAESQQILTKMANFISTATANNPASLPSTSYNYSTGALSTSQTAGEHYVGMYCLMGFGVNPTWHNACFDYFTQKVQAYQAVGYTGTYFKEILTIMYSTLMNGGFVKI